MGGVLMAWGAEGSAVAAVDSFEDYFAEYAAIRQRVGVLHMPWRGLVKVTGADAADLLHRMITNEVNGLAKGKSNHALLLNTKGRIDADFVVMKLGDAVWLDAGKFNTAGLIDSLEKMVFVEEVVFENLSEAYEHFFVTGPGAAALMQKVLDKGDVAGLAEWDCVEAALCGGAACLIQRRDETGALGFHLHVPSADAERVYDALLSEAGWEAHQERDAQWAEKRREGLRGRPIGWGAYNTARIEAGTPLYMIDFGTDSLPGETGILDEVISFTKGCYLGQEIVARMQNLGHPKRMLVGLKFETELIADAGNPVMETSEEGAEPKVIGGVTSSTASPLRGNQSIAFAVMKWGKHKAGEQVQARTEDHVSAATISGLRMMDS